MITTYKPKMAMLPALLAATAFSGASAFVNPAAVHPMRGLSLTSRAKVCGIQRALLSLQAIAFVGACLVVWCWPYSAASHMLAVFQSRRRYV